ncbi:MAG: hypothetical protein RJA61_467, partial [Candidatus Parcubacteria bacterium]
MKNIIPTIFIVLIIGLVSYGIFYLIQKSTGDTGQTLSPALTSLTLEKPNFVVKGRGLAKVEVWAIPTGTDITESSYVKIGIADSIVSSGEQRFNIPIPKEPMLLTEIFARGFDDKGRLVGKVSLNIKGASDIYRELWLEAPQQTLFLKVGETGMMGDLSVKVLKVVSDSRCPTDVVCIQAGNVIVQLELALGTKKSAIS